MHGVRAVSCHQETKLPPLFFFFLNISNEFLIGLELTARLDCVVISVFTALALG